MPSNLDDLFDREPEDLLEREERCQKAMKTVGKAIFMRVVICGLLTWVIISSVREIWVAGLILLVLLINVTGSLPLIAELKKRRAEWKQLLAEEEQ